MPSAITFYSLIMLAMELDGPADSNSVPYTIQNVGSQQIIPTLDFSSYSFTSGENSAHHDPSWVQFCLRPDRADSVDQQFYRYLQLRLTMETLPSIRFGGGHLCSHLPRTPWLPSIVGNKTYAPTTSQSKTFTINGTGTQQTTITLNVPNSFNPGSSSSVVSVNVGCNSACGVVQLTVDNQEWRDWTSIRMET